MARRATKGLTSFIAMVFIMYFIILPVIVAVGAGKAGSIKDLIVGIVDLIPFGEGILGITIGILNSIFDTSIDVAIDQSVVTPLYIVQNIAKSIFATIIFEALNKLFAMLCHLTEPNTFWAKAKSYALIGFDAILAAFFAPMPINYIFENLNKLSTFWQFAVSLITGGVLIGGAVLFFTFLKSIPILTALGLMFCKYILLGAVSMFCSYVFMLAVLVGISKGLFDILLMGLGGFVIEIIILIIVTKMLSSVFSDAW